MQSAKIIESKPETPGKGDDGPLHPETKPKKGILDKIADGMNKAVENASGGKV